MPQYAMYKEKSTCRKQMDIGHFLSHKSRNMNGGKLSIYENWILFMEIYSFE